MTATDHVFPRDPSTAMNRIHIDAIRAACLDLCDGLPDNMIDRFAIGFRTGGAWSAQAAMQVAAACAMTKGLGADNYHVALVIQGLREFGYPGKEA